MRVTETSGILSPLLANVAYTCAMSIGLTSAPPSVRLKPNVLPASGAHDVMPILVPVSIALSTPTKSSVLTAGIFSELPSALRMVVWPWKMLSKLPGHQEWVGVSFQHVG